MNKIAIITQWHPFSGGGKYAFNIFDRFSEKRNYLASLVYYEYGSNKIDRKDVVKVQHSNFDMVDKTLNTYHWFPEHIPKGYDLYHATNNYLVKVAKFRKPCVVTHMDLIPVLFPKGKFRLIGIFMKRLFKYYKEAEHIICLSDVVRDELLQFVNIPEEKISVIAPGFDEKLYKPIRKHTAREMLNLPINKKIVLNVGSTELDKGVPLLVKILSEINDKNIMLVRIGSGSTQYDARKFDTLELHGIPEEQMPLYYAAADVFAAPFNYGAGFVYPPLEAIACGTPALVSNLQFNGYVNVPQDMFKGMLQNILNDKKFRERLASKGLEASKHYTLTKEVQKIDKVYKKVLE